MFNGSLNILSLQSGCVGLCSTKPEINIGRCQHLVPGWPGASAGLVEIPASCDETRTGHVNIAELRNIWQGRNRTVLMLPEGRSGENQVRLQLR